MKATGHRSESPASDGFTLLEIMIALAIIGMTVTVILHTVNHHADIMYENTLSTRMFQTAKEKLVELEMDNIASKEAAAAPGVTYEKIVSQTGDPDIIELRAIVKGHGKNITLREFARKKETTGSGYAR